MKRKMLLCLGALLLPLAGLTQAAAPKSGAERTRLKKAHVGALLAAPSSLQFLGAASLQFLGAASSAPTRRKQASVRNAGQSEHAIAPPQASDKRPAKPTRAAAQASAIASDLTAPQVSGWQFFGSLRVRIEDYRWFDTNKADGTYSFVGALLRTGVTRQTSRDETVLELAAPALLNLPTKASAAAPQGALGQGANYHDINGGQVAGLFVKQGYIRFKNAGAPDDSLRLGRFEFSDGAETTPTDPGVAYLKQNRIAQRLIGPFLFTHIGRSFDGAQFVQATPQRTTTALFAFPTRGVFSLQGMDTLTGVQIGYLSATYPLADKRNPGEGRLFAAYYGDQRNVVKTDSRPLAVRTADKAGINIGTFGGHYVRLFPLGAGKLDALFWGAGQIGTWGAQHHGAVAYAAELGYQPRWGGLKPWLRLGCFHADGDGKPGDNQHGTFFPILPTPRIYARDPFYTEANLNDLFVQAILRPNPRFTARADLHQLALANQNDLWYSGGGAFQNNNFGYTGRPSNGHRGLATLTDLSLDYQPRKNLSLTLYFAYVRGRNVISAIYQGKDSTFGYLEATMRF